MQKIAIVTGGTRGIGAAIAIALDTSGYKVIANYISSPEVAENFQKQTGITTKRWDVSNFEASHQAVKEIQLELGDVSILVNNAGITSDKMMHKMDLESWQSVLQVNLFSCFNMCSAVINQMRQNSYGRIVNISSINALTGQLGQVNYSASKAGILGLTKALAKESASKNITVNAIAPGYINTEMTRKMPPQVLENLVSQIPIGRIGEVEDIARTVLFLVDEKASFITGSTLSVNGGMHMS
jgi:acetoacetyl-CoA reductase